MQRLLPVAMLVHASLSTSPTWAEDQSLPSPIPAAEQKTLEQFGEANKACGEWSDGCVVCVRQTNGSAACSLPGIACQPKALTCRTAAVDTPPAKPTPENPKPEAPAPAAK